MSAIEQTLEDNLQELKDALAERLDATNLYLRSLSQIKAIISEAINSANSTSSYDERIEKLVLGHQGVIDYHEKEYLSLIEDVDGYRKQIELLEKIQADAAAAEESKKKEAEPSPTEPESPIQE